MVMVECGRGERRVKVAVEVRRWKVASSMKAGAEGEGGGVVGSRFGLVGGWSWGVGMEMAKWERARPRVGLWGMLPEWVVRVMVVL